MCNKIFKAQIIYFVCVINSCTIRINFCRAIQIVKSTKVIWELAGHVRKEREGEEGETINSLLFI